MNSMSPITLTLYPSTALLLSHSVFIVSFFFLIDFPTYFPPFVPLRPPRHDGQQFSGGAVWRWRCHRDGAGCLRPWQAHSQALAAVWGLWEPLAAPRRHLGLGAPRTTPAPCQGSGAPGPYDQPAAVSTEGPAEVSVEAPLCLALPRTCGRLSAQSAGELRLFGGFRPVDKGPTLTGRLSRLWSQTRIFPAVTCPYPVVFA